MFNRDQNPQIPPVVAPQDVTALSLYEQFGGPTVDRSELEAMERVMSGEWPVDDGQAA